MEELTKATEVSTQLMEYGPLGMLCIFLTVAVYFLYKDLQKGRDEQKEERMEFIRLTKKYIENEVKQTDAMAQQSAVLTELKDMIREMWKRN